MRLATGDDEIGSVRQPVEKTRHAAGVETGLVKDAVLARRKLGDSSAEPFRVLFGEKHRNIEHFRRVDQPPGVGDNRGALLDRRHQPGLKIDHQQGRTAWINRQHRCQDSFKREREL